MTFGVCGTKLRPALDPIAASAPRFSIGLEPVECLLFFPSFFEDCLCFFAISGEVLGLMTTLSIENRTCFGDFGLLGERIMLRKETSEREDDRRMCKTSGRGSEEEIGVHREGEPGGEKAVEERVADEERWSSMEVGGRLMVARGDRAGVSSRGR